MQRLDARKIYSHSLRHGESAVIVRQRRADIADLFLDSIGYRVLRRVQRPAVKLKRRVIVLRVKLAVDSLCGQGIARLTAAGYRAIYDIRVDDIDHRPDQSPAKVTDNRVFICRRRLNHVGAPPEV